MVSTGAKWTATKLNGCWKESQKVTFFCIHSTIEIEFNWEFSLNSAGTFLLRDSAQEEYLFSVSFRKYGRSLHARIEQFNHKFSFDCHDPGVFTSPEGNYLLRVSHHTRELIRLTDLPKTLHYSWVKCCLFFHILVTGLLEHYKDPACVMFFEPALTQPLNRNFCFTLQQLCRSLIVSNTTYDGVNDLSLPTTLKSYLKEYHYKQRVRVKRYDQ